MKAHVDKNVCIGCGLCEGTCPLVFFMDGDGLANTNDIDAEDERESVNEAKENCPVGAISTDSE